MKIIHSTLKWFDKEDLLPLRDKRVLTYSPEYKKEDYLMFRIMDSQFVKIATDVKWWAYIEKPE